MSDYDFKNLNDKEFEILCTDLLSTLISSRFERFKPGKDLGVDGRFFSSTGKEVILQCKHWIKSPFTKLIASLHSVEKPKIDRLKPVRYILAVSNNLSRLDKSKLSAALAPHVKRESDIYGCEDLNDILRKNPEIEKQHYKLWISSTAVLELFLNKDVLGRSADEIALIHERAGRYVLTENHQKALAQLERLRVLIVTGAPGIGKTTLAEQLSLSFICAGYQFVKIDENCSEAERVFEAEAKQMFLFDDFLGRNYLEALTGHEGTKISSFIRRISRYQNKVLILTSRSTIMNQGRVFLDSFTHDNLNQNEYELRIASLTNLDRGRILYNHIWNSNLTEEHIEEIYLGKRYITIIKHKNFNPRLISYITDTRRLTSVPPDEYWTYITKSLEDPSQIWQHPFEAQLDDFSRALVLLVVVNGRRISESDLASSYYRYLALPFNQHMKGRPDYDVATRILVGSFLTRFISTKTGEGEFDLFNPSIGDYVLARHLANIETIKSAFLSLQTQASLLTLKSLKNDDLLKDVEVKSIALAIMQDLIRVGLSPEKITFSQEIFNYVTATWEFDGALQSAADTLSIALMAISDSIATTPSFLHVAAWAFKKKLISEDSVMDYVDRRVRDINSDEDISVAWKLIKSFNLGPKADALRECFSETLAALIEDNLSEFVELTDAYAKCDYGDYEQAEVIVAEMLSDKLAELGIDDDLFDCSELVGAHNVRGKMDDYFQNDGGDPYATHERGITPSGIPEDSAIHDLFDRG